MGFATNVVGISSPGGGGGASTGSGGGGGGAEDSTGGRGGRSSVPVLSNEIVTHGKAYRNHAEIAKPRCSEQILQVPSPFVILRFHCRWDLF